MRTLIIDNYDSFTFNLYQLLAEVNGVAPVVVRNDQLAWRALYDLAFDAVIVSPGPGRPERPRDLGISRDALLSADIPVLGVCLGHEALGHLYGGTVVAAPEIMHGRLSGIHHDGSALFEGIPQGFAAVRYHSLVVANELPDCLERLAWTADGVLMAIRHRHRPLWGVQFHPESICTEHGRRLLGNFSELARRFTNTQRRAPARTDTEAALSVVPPGHAPAAGHAPLAVHSRKLDVQVDTERAFVGLFGGAPRAFWLDSSEAERASRPGLSRFSFMGSASGPHALLLRYRTDPRELTLLDAAGEARVDESVFDYLARELDRRRVASSDLPFDFNGGFVGYFGYELKAECGAARAHGSALPDAQLLFADRLLAFDHVERATYLVCLATPDGDGAAEATAWLDRTEAALAALPPLLPSPPCPPGAARLAFRPARAHATYMADVEACLREIRAGETYEVCVTNQLRADVALDALSFYRALRRSNPAPYAAFLRFDDLAVASSSPERFLRIDRGRHVESRPIKGTARRGRTPEEDAALREALSRSEKTRAENLMIVDLLRNDLGIACEIGSVHVPRLMEVEPYATLYQLVSTVRGRLRPGLGAVDCVKLAFPGGSMTGAPKLRTMALLDRIEGAPRGVYSGAIGYLSLSGAADLSVVIRTAVLDRTGISIGVGGAVVALSEPHEELEEALLKGQALVRAAQAAARAPVD